MSAGRRDLRLALLALLLLALPAAYFLWSSQSARQRREATLAGVPEFPAPHQAPRRKPPPVAQRPAPAPVKPPPPPPAERPAEKRADPMTAFVLAPAQSVGLVHVNALFNTPLFEKLKECMPDDFRYLDQASQELGFDVTRDVDRVAMVAGGTAISGFFEGKPIAESLTSRGGGELRRRDYRGQTILENGGRCASQLGNLVLLSSAGSCEALIDRALLPPPADASDELYGDIFFKSDLKQLQASPAPPELKQLFDALDGMTVRANVWDSVALSVEGNPRNRRDAGELAQMARGAISVVKGQLDDEDVELQALADLAQVSTRGDKLEINLALPAQDLFQRLHFPCATRDAGQ
jgi:hypothetical protein